MNSKKNQRVQTAQRKSRRLSILLVILFAISILSSCEYTPTVLQYVPELSANGTTVLSIWNSHIMQNLDMEGNVLWRLDVFKLGLDFEILDNMDMLTMTVDYIRLHREGTLVWVLDAPNVHHCITMMPNGHIMYLFYYYIEVEGWDKPFLADGIREVDPSTGETIWEWRAGDYISTEDYCPWHIDPDYSSYVGGDEHYDWTHANTVVYREDESAVYMNFRHIDRLVKIAYPSGEILWSMGSGGDFGEGLFSHSHDPEFLENGNILLFDNGNHRAPYECSRAIEIAFDPDLGWAEVAWQWPPEPWFFDGSMGDANRLPNGNTLVTSSHHGKVYEVTQSGEIAWALFLEPTWQMPEGLAYALYKAEMVFP